MHGSSRSGSLRIFQAFVVLLTADAGALCAAQQVTGHRLGNAARARGSGEPSVLQGTFSPPRVGARNTAAVEAGDLNGDGWLDLVVLADHLRVLFSNGTPGFGFTEEVHDLTAPAEQLVLVDLDQDSDLDAVASIPFGGPLVLENRGDGSFGPAASLPCFGSGAELAARDVDGDIDVDLMSGNPLGQDLCIYRNAGDGAFPDVVQVSFSIPAQATGYAFCDVDQDADPDIVVAARTSSLLVLENLGAGVFVTGASIPVPGLFVPTDLAGAHLDADGREDLVVLEYNQTGLPMARLHALLATGGGAFAELGPWELSEGLFAAGSLVVADADLDGDADVLVPEGGAERLEVRWNDGQGALASARIVATGENASDVEVGDFDRDGSADLVVLNEANDDLWLLSGDGQGRFSSRLPFGSGITAIALASGDFDQDGDADLATTGGRLFASQATTYRNDGRARFPEIVTYPFALSGTATDVLLADLDGDGAPELGVARSGVLRVFPNLGDGAFGASVPYPFLLPTSEATGIAAADVDRDGDLDVAGALPARGSVSLLRNDGSGAFTSGSELAAGPEPLDPAFGDLDADGYPELLVAGSAARLGTTPSDEREPGFLALLAADGAGGYLAPVVLAAGQGSISLCLGDQDGDGLLDALVPSFREESVALFLGQPGGTFLAPLFVPVPQGPVRARVSDLDRDGLADLSVAGGGVLAVRLGGGDVLLGPERTYGTSSGPIDLVLADFDGDGDLDHAVVPECSRDALTLVPNPARRSLVAVPAPRGSAGDRR